MEQRAVPVVHVHLHDSAVPGPAQGLPQVSPGLAHHFVQERRRAAAPRRSSVAVEPIAVADSPTPTAQSPLPVSTRVTESVPASDPLDDTLVQLPVIPTAVVVLPELPAAPLLP
jgi:hypothetical protein